MMKKEGRIHILENRFWRVVVNIFVTLGLAVLYYIGFSFFFDTPAEYYMKNSTVELRRQYDALSARFDTLMQVMENVSERDRNVFGILFESDPYDFDGVLGSQTWKEHERLLQKGNRELDREFSDKLARLHRNVDFLNASFETLRLRAAASGDAADHIPAIQPVVNDDLTLLTCSFGLRIHPFYRSLTPHMGVDYTVPEGTRVFATADGTVKEVSSRSTSSGLTVVISHGDGYETSYSHLNKTSLRRGSRVRRGDIIGLSGNTGLSLAPHLHYEVRHNGMRVDPIHYFFMELSPKDYQRMIRIACSGMQSFD